jgi:hypothetical protein
MTRIHDFAGSAVTFPPADAGSTKKTAAIRPSLHQTVNAFELPAQSLVSKNQPAPDTKATVPPSTLGVQSVHAASSPLPARRRCQRSLQLVEQTNRLDERGGQDTGCPVFAFCESNFPRARCDNYVSFDSYSEFTSQLLHSSPRRRS